MSIDRSIELYFCDRLKHANGCVIYGGPCLSTVDLRASLPPSKPMYQGEPKYRRELVLSQHIWIKLLDADRVRRIASDFRLRLAGHRQRRVDLRRYWRQAAGAFRP